MIFIYEFRHFGRLFDLARLFRSRGKFVTIQPHGNSVTPIVRDLFVAHTFYISLACGTLINIERLIVGIQNCLFYVVQISPGVLLVVTAIAVETNLNFLAALSIENPDNVQLYSIADLTTGPVLRDQELFSVKNPNVNLTGQPCFGGSRLFVLDSNNGIKAFDLNLGFVPNAAPYSITSVSKQGGEFVLTWTTEVGRSYQVQFKNVITDTWANLGSPIAATGTSTSTNVAISGVTQFYRIQTP